LYQHVSLRAPQRPLEGLRPHLELTKYATCTTTQGGWWIHRKGTNNEAERLGGIFSTPSHRAAFHCTAFFSHNKLCNALCRGNNKHCTGFPTAYNKPCITPPHPPEEQEMRKTAKASFVASPIFHPNLILSLERELKQTHLCNKM